MIHLWQTRTGCRRSLSHVDSSCCKDNHTCWARAALPSAFLAVEQQLAGCGAWSPTNLHTSGSGLELPWEAAPPLHHPDGWAHQYHHKHCSTQFMLQRQRARKSGVHCSPALGLLQKEIFPFCSEDAHNAVFISMSFSSRCELEQIRSSCFISKCPLGIPSADTLQNIMMTF